MTLMTTEQKQILHRCHVTLLGGSSLIKMQNGQAQLPCEVCGKSQFFWLVPMEDVNEWPQSLHERLAKAKYDLDKGIL